MKRVITCIAAALLVTAIAHPAAQSPGSRPAQTRTREVIHRDNVSIDVVAEGKGPLLLLLPSLGRDADEFDAAAGYIAAGGFRVLRPQPRGYGRSAGPMEHLTLHDFARDIAAVIEHQNAGPAMSQSQ